MSDESTVVKDPVCGKEVDTLRARAVGIFGGVTYYFCSAECKSKFKDPRRVPREPTAQGKLAEAESKRAKKREPEPAPPKEADAPAAEPAGGDALLDDDELPPKKSGAGAWVIVAMLFAAAGTVLFFALK
jgi:YHS domain-containing protein